MGQVAPENSKGTCLQQTGYEAQIMAESGETKTSWSWWSKSTIFMWYASARWIDFPQAPSRIPRHHSGNDSQASQEMRRSDTETIFFNSSWDEVPDGIFPRRPTVSWWLGLRIRNFRKLVSANHPHQNRIFNVETTNFFFESQWRVLVADVAVCCSCCARLSGYRSTWLVGYL